jgi:hypothetical protein
VAREATVEIKIPTKVTRVGMVVIKVVKANMVETKAVKAAMAETKVVKVATASKAVRNTTHPTTDGKATCLTVSYRLYSTNSYYKY